MAATKTRRQLTAASTAVAINSSVPGGEFNLSTAYFGSRYIVRITNSASAPTVAPVVTFHTGGVSGEKVQAYTAAGVTTPSTVTDLIFVSEQGDMFVNATVTLGAAVNGVTIECIGLEATGL